MTDAHPSSRTPAPHIPDPALGRHQAQPPAAPLLAHRGTQSETITWWQRHLARPRQSIMALQRARGRGVGPESLTPKLAVAAVLVSLLLLPTPGAAQFCPTACPAGTQNFGAGFCSCTACPAATWSPEPNFQFNCIPWATCFPGTRVSVSPTSIQDRLCTACSSGTFSIGSNVATCTQLSDCAAGNFVSFPGSPAADRTCQACATGTFAPSVNSGSCFPHSTCPAGTILGTAGTATTDRTCEACQQGTFTETTNSASCTAHQVCLPGSRVSVAPSPSADRECKPCGADEYSDQANAASCTTQPAPCVPGEVVLQAPSITTPRQCGACATGTFSAVSDATACTAVQTCPPGTLVSSTPTVSSDRQCKACGTDQYSDKPNELSCTAQPTCSPGEVITQAASPAQRRLCAACASGTFSSTANQGTCTPHTTCPPGTHVSVAGSPTTDRQCAACGSGTFAEVANAPACTPQPTCLPGEFVARPASVTQGRQCSACFTAAFSNTTNQNQCTAWRTCAPPEVEVLAPTSSSDRVCQASECQGFLTNTVNSILTAAACPQRGYRSTCNVSCPSGYLGETTTFTCDISTSGSGSPVDWDGRFPVCYRYTPKLVATANSQYIGAAVEHNSDSEVEVEVETDVSDPAFQGFVAAGSTGQLQGFFPADVVGDRRVTLKLEFDEAESDFLTTFTVTVNPPLQVSETTLTIAQNELFEGITPGIVGGSPPFVFTLEEGTLPRGLRVSAANGQVLGIPEVQGRFNASIAVTDSTGAKLALQPFRLIVTEGLTINWNRTEPIPVGVQGEQFALAPPPNVTSNAQGELSYSAGGELPPGLSVDPRTGTLFGVPVAPRAAPYNLTIRASDDTNILVVVERIAFAVRRPFDCDSPGNGPNGLGCGAGECLDAVPFDESFACNCSGVPFEGDNCEVPIVQAAQRAAAAGLSTPVIGSVAGMGSLVLILAVLFLLARRRAQRLANKPFDFEDELERMQEEGLLRTSRVPREIPRRKIKTLDKLGAGQFGDVFKGTVNESDTTGVPEYLAAIKTLKEDPSGFEKTELMREAATMAQFSHENVVNLIGVCTSGMPYLLVVQFCEHGALSSHLKHIKQANDVLDFHSIMGIAHDVAKGMEYLNGMGLVHRDLAARNVLLDSHYTCKVADFGLSRDLDAGEYYRSAERGMIPIRWTAPEAIEDRKFSSQSDMWAYAVTLHEVFTYGELPYGDMTNQVVWLQVQNGYRLPREPNCPVEFYEGVMLPSWAAEPADRPSFPAVLEFLETEYKMLGEGGGAPQANMKRRRRRASADGGSVPGSAATTGSDLPAAPGAEPVDLMPEDATGYVDFNVTDLDMDPLKGMDAKLAKPTATLGLPPSCHNPYVMDASQPRYERASSPEGDEGGIRETRLGAAAEPAVYEEPVVQDGRRGEEISEEYLSVGRQVTNPGYDPIESLGGAGTSPGTGLARQGTPAVLGAAAVYDMARPGLDSSQADAAGPLYDEAEEEVGVPVYDAAGFGFPVATP